MTEKQRPPKPPKVIEPEFTWGETPGGQPELIWEHAARPLWAQTVPEQDGVLLMELARMLYRRASTGEVLWQEVARDFPDELAADANGLVFANSASVAELDPANGRLRWRQRPGGTITGITLTPDTAFVSTHGPLFALNRQNRQQRWRTPCAWEPELHVYPEANLLLVDDPETETIRALDAATGAQLWEYQAAGQPVVAGPLLPNAVAISGHAAGLAAVDLQTGEARWSHVTERTFEAPGVRLGDTLFCTDGTVHALDVATGEIRWQRTLENDEDGVFALRIHRDVLCAETWRGRLLALNPEDGALRWERSLGQVHGLTGDEHTLFLRVHVAEPVGRWSVVAVDLATGDLRWELIARRMVPDVTRFNDLLVVELKNQVLTFRIGT